MTTEERIHQTSLTLEQWWTAIENNQKDLFLKGWMDHPDWIREVNDDLETPLSLAIFYGSLDVLKVLHEKKMDFSEENHYKETPLTQAILRGHLHLIPFLLSIEPYKNPEYGSQSDTVNRVVREGYKEILDLLIEARWDVNLKPGKDSVNDEKWPPLFHAVAGNRVDLLKRLIEAGADVNFLTQTNHSALTLFCKCSWVEVIQVLIQSGCSINHQNNAGLTPLMSAVRGKNIDVVKELLRHGADITLKDHEGKSALMMAVESRNAEVIAVLEHHQAQQVLSQIPGLKPSSKPQRI